MDSPGSIFTARQGRLVVLKLVGAVRASVREGCRLSAALEAFLHDLFQRDDFDDVLIDLNETTAIDSTNLGLLAQIAQFTRRQKGRRPTILSSNPDITIVLESVAFDQVFIVVREATPPGDMPLECLAGLAGGELDQVRLMLQAHRALVSIHSANQVQFRNVIELLEEEAQKQSTLRPDHVTT